MDPTQPYPRPTRRSYTNIQHLTLSPLPTSHPASTRILPSRRSYILQRSAPTSPGILSRSSSSTRLHTSGVSPLTTSKSSSALIRPNASHSHLPRKPARGQPRKGKANSASSDWLERAGLAITSTTRDAKGQSWLASRESSTSLISHGSDDEDEDGTETETESARELRGGEDADDEFSPYSTRAGVSRATSRFASRRGSRGGSKRGSGAELRAATPGRRGVVGEQEGGYFGEADFVDKSEFEDGEAVEGEGLRELEERLEDEEMGRVVRSRGSGWVERLVGWSLFEGVEGEEGEREEDLAGGEGSETKRVAEAVRTSGGLDGDEIEQVPPVGEEGGWKDAAWLLSVATKVIL